MPRGRLRIEVIGGQRDRETFERVLEGYCRHHAIAPPVPDVQHSWETSYAPSGLNAAVTVGTQRIVFEIDDERFMVSFTSATARDAALKTLAGCVRGNAED